MLDSDEEVPNLVEESLENGIEVKNVSSVAASEPTCAEIVNKPPVPVCILTGWLGSGKTTLLTYLLHKLGNQGKKIAIVQNEVSVGGVEDALRLQDDSGVFGEVLELANGCVCCSVRGDFALALEALLRRQDFDYVFLECSGLADPGPLARMFWIDEELESNIMLDCVVSLVDAKTLKDNLCDRLSQSKQVIRQVAFADKIIINKRDLVSEKQLEELKRSIRALNSGAEIIVTERGVVDLNDIMYIKAYEGEGVKDHCFDRDKLRATECKLHERDDHEHDNEFCPECEDAEDDHVHDMSITTHVSEVKGHYLDHELLIRWLGDLLWVYEKGINKGSAAITQQDHIRAEDSEDDKDCHNGKMELFRYKGLLALTNEKKKFFLQGVQEVFDVQEGLETWPEGHEPHSRFVFIGKNLDKARLDQGVLTCIAK